jgi:nucleotidyltransferase/DNA polymerase involved in DNA repair
MNMPEKDQTVNWLFLDLNAFFASCEQQENSALRGKPIIVVQMLTDSTVAIAASYEAKAFGIKTGTRVMEAKHLCPSLFPCKPTTSSIRSITNAFLKPSLAVCRSRKCSRLTKSPAG